MMIRREKMCFFLNGLSQVFIQMMNEIEVFVLPVCNDKLRPPNLSELIPMIFNMGLTHLSSEASTSDVTKLLIEFTEIDININTIHP